MLYDVLFGDREMPRIEALNERLTELHPPEETELCDYTAEEDEAYISRIVQAERQERWWAEQILYHQRQRRGFSSPLDRWIVEQLDAGRGTAQLQPQVSQSAALACP